MRKRGQPAVYDEIAGSGTIDVPTEERRIVRQMGCKRPVVSNADGEHVTSGKVRSPKAPERELLWTVACHSRRIMCELRYHGKYGVEYRLFCDNEFYQGRGFQTRELAVNAADAVRRRLVETGWSG